MTHDLKTWDGFFKMVWEGKKKFEVRKNDRDFKNNDVLTLMEYNPQKDQFSGRWIQCNVDYILHGGEFGIMEGVVVMSITEIGRFPTN